MSTCATCRHWLPPGQRTDFRHVMSVYPADGDFHRIRDASDAADKLFGQCATIDLVTEVREDEPIPLAITRDGSEYMAHLFTQASFGCTLHEPAHDEAPPTAEAMRG